jgi:hypothetical protein
MTRASALLQWFSFFSLATLQKPYLPFLKDVVVLVCMSGLMLFVVSLVLVCVVADKEMHLYLTKATRALLPEGVVAIGNQVAVPTSYDAFVSATVTMSLVGAMAVLLCVSFMVQLVYDGMRACVLPMTVLTVNTVKPKCWDSADDFRGKVPPPHPHLTDNDGN